MGAWPGLLLLSALFLVHHQGLCQQSTASFQDIAEQECIAKRLPGVARLCQPSNTTAFGDQLTNLLRTCLVTGPSDASQQPARILLVQNPAVDIIRNETKAFQDITGIPIELLTPSVVDLQQGGIRTTSIDNPTNTSATHEAWLVAPVVTADGASRGSFADLSNLVALDSRLDWTGIVQQLRESALLYQSKVVTLPLSSATALLLYRKDIFDRYNISVPRTWRELMATIQRYNGTEGLHGFCGGWGPCTELALTLIRQTLATVHQTNGPSHGWFIDPYSLVNASSPRHGDMGLLMNSPAALEMFGIIRELYQWSPPDTMQDVGCQVNASDFVQGRCLMTFDYVSFKVISHASAGNPMAGRLGIAFMPGSDHVLDRTSNTLVPCDSLHCPYATRYTNPDGSTLLVNHSPGYDAALLALNAYSPPDLGFYTFRVVSYICSPEVNDLMVFHPTALVFPSRSAQVDPARWAQAGFNYADSERYCNAYQDSLSHPNLNLQVRIPVDIFTYLHLVGVNITNTSDSIPVVAANAQQAAVQMLKAQYQSNMSALHVDYFASLNRQLPDLPQSSTATTTMAPSPGHKQRLQPGVMLVLSTVLPVVAAVSIGLLLYWRCLHQRGGLSGPLDHPQPGPLTTLLVTDIENSTPLWEQLPEDVMNVAMVLHDACARKLATQHKGYESVWEGDSFVIAFHSPRPALEFALALQLSLLQLPWPPALLAHPMAAEMWLKPTGAFSPAAPKLIRAVVPSVVQHLAANLGGSSNTQVRADSSTQAVEAARASSNASTGRPSGAGGGMQTLYGPPSCRLPQMTSNGVSMAASSHSPFHTPANSAPLPTVVVTVHPDSNDAPAAGMAAAAGAGNGVMVLGNGCARTGSPTCAAPAPAGEQLMRLSSYRPSGTLAFTASQGSHSSCTGLSPACSAQIPGEPSMTPMSATSWPSPSALEPQGSAQATASEATIKARGGTLLPWSTCQQQVASSWQECSGSEPGAVLVHRGFRVRIGMSVGEASVRYNKIMGRWRYSGPIRAMSNAVAYAARGGQTMVNCQTASALQPGLPPDCCSVYMGSHLLHDFDDDEPVHLVMVLPTQLKARLAISLAPLRTSMCHQPGVLQAPVPSNTTRPGLAYVQPCGLSTLLAWDVQTTLVAVAQLHACMQQQASRWDGFIFQDGLMRVLQDSSTTAAETHSTAAADVDGRALMHLEWRQGSSRVPAAASAHSSTSQGGPPGRSPLSASGVLRGLTGRSSGSSSGGMSGLLSRSTGSKPGSGILLGVAFPDELRALKFALRLRVQLLRVLWPPKLLSHELCEPLGGPSQPMGEGEEFPWPAGLDTSSTQTGTPRPLGHHAAYGGADPPPPLQQQQQDGLTELDLLAARASSISHASIHGRGMDKVRIRVAPKSRQVPGTWYELDAPMLCGLRLRMVLLGEVQDVQPCMRTRGCERAVYAAKHSKHLPQLLKQARQGQVLASAHVMASAGWLMQAIPE